MYGITNCDTIRKARAWLDGHGVKYAFHDYRAQGLDADRLAAWIDEVGWQVLLNKASTTFRELPAGKKEDLDARRARALMLDHPTMIKRPVLDLGGRLLVGFKVAAYEDAFGGPTASA